MITSHEQQYPIITTQDYPRAMRTYSSAHTSSMDSGAPTFRVATNRVSILSRMQARHAIQKGFPRSKK